MPFYAQSLEANFPAIQINFKQLYTLKDFTNLKKIHIKPLCIQMFIWISIPFKSNTLTFKEPLLLSNMPSHPQTTQIRSFYYQVCILHLQTTPMKPCPSQVYLFNLESFKLDFCQLTCAFAPSNYSK